MVIWRRRYGNDCVGTLHSHGAKLCCSAGDDAKGPDERTVIIHMPEWPKICKTDYGQQEAKAVSAMIRGFTRQQSKNSRKIRKAECARLFW